MCIGEKKNKKNQWFVTQDWDNVTTGKKKKKRTTEPLRSQEGFLEKVIPELSLKEREKHSYEWAVGMVISAFQVVAVHMQKQRERKSIDLENSSDSLSF